MEAISKTVVRHSACSCGKPVDIEYNSATTARTDGIRPYHPGAAADVMQFRCDSCRRVIDENVPGANHSAKPCECTFYHRTLGDGCEVCNPEQSGG